MLSEAIMITALGMGGVFMLLALLICVLHILQILAGKDADLEKVAVAIAVAKRGNNG